MTLRVPSIRDSSRDYAVLRVLLALVQAFKTPCRLTVPLALHVGHVALVGTLDEVDRLA